MATSKAISVELKARQQSILQRQLESGHYESVSEVIGDALRALDEREAVYDEWLRAKVKASMANRKPNIPADVVFKRLEARHGRRTKATKSDA